jgi:D-beta-D-heptose 7-phosphate kinase/D-beta-D-heptose 1-phosphate adenosyltransferase
VTVELLKTIEALEAPDVLVVGDLVLDRYVVGTVDRISPEAPIQVLRHEREYERPGGMASVACNLARLGARVRVVGLVGEDAEGAALRRALGQAGIDTGTLVAEAGRPTTVKTRYVAASHHARHQILRVDRELTEIPRPETCDALLASARAALPGARIVVLSDYGKGVLRGTLCRQVLEAARAESVPVIVDPKGVDFERYRGATAITPNRSEAGAYTGSTIRTPDAAMVAARVLLDRLDLAVAFITLDKDGIFVLERGKGGVMIHTEPREVFDVTGAGDNVLAVLACALAGGADARTAAVLANIAGGIAVEQFGAVTVGWEEIASRIAAAIGGEAKLLDAELLARLLGSARKAGRRVVFTNGCFDILHPGHVDFLRRARALGDLLVVGVNDDASVTRLKGPGRPVNTLAARAAVLGGLAAVDYVVAFPEDTPDALVRRVRPDVLVKGDDWKGKGVVGREFVEAYGGRVELLPLVAGYSTTKTIEQLGRKGG